MQNADNLEHCNSGLIHPFLKPIASIHGVCSVLSLHAVFAFQNCLIGCAETKGQTCIQENWDYSRVAYLILRSTKKKYCGLQLFTP